MIQVYLNGKEYLSSTIHKVQFNNPLKSGCVQGFYYGSSTRLNGGEIWHPQNGYSTLRILVQVLPFEESEWVIIYDQDVDFKQEAIKFAQIQNKMNIEFEKLISKSIGNEIDIKNLIKNNDLTIQGISSGTVCNLFTGSEIILTNEQYEVTLFLRDLHRYEGEVQISGLRYKLLQTG
jgi:hypothetical protein